MVDSLRESPLGPQKRGQRKKVSMIRGIHRFVFSFGRGVVKVRAQSQSARGQAYTVRHARVNIGGPSKEDFKTAVEKAVSEVYSTL